MKQVIIYILSFLGILSQMSCDDQLNALPTQSKVVGNVIVDQKSAEVLGICGQFGRLPRWGMMWIRRSVGINGGGIH